MSLATSTNYLTPTGREEAWRFTPLSALGGLHDAQTRLTARESLVARELPAGVFFETVSAAELSQALPSDEIAQRVRGAVDSVARLRISAHNQVAEPIFLDRNTASLDPEASRLVIEVGTHAHAKVVISNAGQSTLGEDIEIHLADGAHLQFVSLQEWDTGAIHAARHHAVVGRDATFTSHVITVGGSVVRLLPTVEYAGPGASAELNGLYFATDGQHLEHRVHVEHEGPHAKSRVNFKGALAGDKARTVWIGDVFIKATAQGTDTYELNRNLLLSDGARADSVPNLEIETGDIVGAGHASTTGRFDDEQLFYLESRGIPAAEARRLVIRGFFAEIVSKLGLPDIEERIMNRIDAQLVEVGR